MKRILLIYCIVLFISACNKNKGNNPVFISSTPTEQSHGILYLPESVGLNVFYDICASDSFVCCLDFHNDTILKVFSNVQPPLQIGYSMKGQGPDELLFPFFIQNLFQLKNEKIKLFDLNSWSIKELSSDANSCSKLKIDTAIPLPIIPAVKDFNETDSCIYGIDVDMQHGLFFIYNKNEQKIKTIDYPYKDKNLSNKYSPKLIPYLFENHLIVNESADMVCVGMVNINTLYFFDLIGNLKKEIVIGDEIMFPEADSKYLDFPSAKKHIVSMTGNKDFVYCLYNNFIGVTNYSKIFKFDWKGNLISIIQTDINLEKISVTPNNGYIYGIRMSEEGGSDIIRFKVD